MKLQFLENDRSQTYLIVIYTESDNVLELTLLAKLQELILDTIQAHRTSPDISDARTHAQTDPPA